MSRKEYQKLLLITSKLFFVENKGYTSTAITVYDDMNEMIPLLFMMICTTWLIKMTNKS